MLLNHQKVLIDSIQKPVDMSLGWCATCRVASGNIKSSYIVPLAYLVKEVGGTGGEQL